MFNGERVNPEEGREKGLELRVESRGVLDLPLTFSFCGHTHSRMTLVIKMNLETLLQVWASPLL